MLFEFLTEDDLLDSCIIIMYMEGRKKWSDWWRWINDYFQIVSCKFRETCETFGFWFFVRAFWPFLFCSLEGKERNCNEIEQLAWSCHIYIGKDIVYTFQWASMAPTYVFKFQLTNIDIPCSAFEKLTSVFSNFNVPANLLAYHTAQLLISISLFGFPPCFVAGLSLFF